MPASAKQRLVDIVTNIRKAREYIGSLSLDEFVEREIVQDAVCRRLLNASEAATRLKAEYRLTYDAFIARHPAIAWRRFHDLGDRYRHGYDIIDVDLVWRDLHDESSIVAIERAISSEIALL